MATRAPTDVLIETDSPAATAALGERLAAVARAGDLICLWGELGAGKTVLAKGVGAGLGTTTVVASPSFILMAEHAGRLPLFHLDLYRLVGAADALEGGLLDERQAEGLTLIEWPGATRRRRCPSLTSTSDSTSSVADRRRITIRADRRGARAVPRGGASVTPGRPLAARARYRHEPGESSPRARRTAS
jgi:tRNA threonylcarbamoyladenosine biosynthesis protein TsaE